MKPKLHLLTLDGDPLPGEWGAAVLGEYGWTTGPPFAIRILNIPPQVDAYALSIETHDGRNYRRDYYNIFQDPAPSEGPLDWVELIWSWTRWRPATQNDGMFRKQLVFPPIARGNKGWVRVMFTGPPGPRDDDGVLPPSELLADINLMVYV